jgi:hypothetical protein
MNKRIPLPAPVASIYRAVRELEAQFPERKFTPDGHLVGSIGEVIAAKALGLTLHPMSRPGHDAFDHEGDVQIKLTAGKRIAMYADCVRLVVLQIVSPEEAEIVYDGPGAPVWAAASKAGKNGQRSISVARLKHIAMK